MSVSLDDLRILLVEPSGTQRRILQKYLAKCGVGSVVPVRTMKAALEALHEDKADVVLSAMHLPDGRGWEMLRRIRLDAEISDVPFLLISSESEAKELEPIRQGGTVAIIKKPCSQDDLYDALNHAVDFLTKESLELEEVDIEDIRALVVDDSRTARRFITTVLSQLGIEQISEAADGAQAAEEMQVSFFDIVFTDFNMPNMNGQQLVEWIRNSSNQPDIPVLMITSEKSGARIAGVEKAGVSAIIDKPFEVERVRRILMTVFN